MAKRRRRRSTSGGSRAIPIGVALALIGLAGFVVLNYTSLPFRYFARSLVQQGLRFEGVGGSLHSGFQISKIIFRDADVQVELHRAILRVKPGLSSSRMEIPSLTAEDGSISLALGGRLKTYPLQHISLGQVLVDTKAGTAHLDRLFEQGPAFDINAGWIDLDRGGDISLADLAYVTLKPTLAPELIRVPIDIQFKGEYRAKTLQSATLTTFGNRFHWDWTQGISNLHVRNLNLASFLKTEMPMQNLQMDVALNIRKLGDLTTKGTFDWRGHRFVMNKGAFLLEDGDALYMIIPQIMAYKNILQGTEKPFLITSKRHENARETLAQLFFKRPLRALKADHIALVEHDARYFEDVLIAPEVKTSAKAQPPAVKRATASRHH